MATIITRILSKFRAPALPLAGLGFVQTDEQQFRNVLRIYFNQIDNTMFSLLESSYTTAVVALINGTTATITNNLNNAQTLTKNGTGDYTLTFTQPLTQTTYARLLS